jgi:hypothetical protein
MREEKRREERAENFYEENVVMPLFCSFFFFIVCLLCQVCSRSPSSFNAHCVPSALAHSVPFTPFYPTPRLSTISYHSLPYSSLSFILFPICHTFTLSNSLLPPLTLFFTGSTICS